MVLLFGNRPFEFSDFFALFQDGQFDMSKLDYIQIVNKNIEAGFKHIEITGDLVYVLPGILSPKTISKLIELKDEKGITFSVHLPLWAIEPTAFSPYIREASVKSFVDVIEWTKPLDPLCWVLHPTGTLTVEFMNMNLPELAQGFMMHQFTSYAANTIKETLERTNIPSRKLAVENIEYPFNLMYPIIQQMDLSICFDTGHLLAGFSGQISIMKFIDKYYDRIIELHLHDGKFPRIDHKPLGEYDLPVRELLLKLLEKNFAGPLIYELNLQEAIQSMNYIKNNIPEALV